MVSQYPKHGCSGVNIQLLGFPVDFKIEICHDFSIREWLCWIYEIIGCNLGGYPIFYQECIDDYVKIPGYTYFITRFFELMNYIFVKNQTSYRKIFRTNVRFRNQKRPAWSPRISCPIFPWEYQMLWWSGLLPFFWIRWGIPIFQCW